MSRNCCPKNLQKPAPSISGTLLYFMLWPSNPYVQEKVLTQEHKMKATLLLLNIIFIHCLTYHCSADGRKKILAVEQPRLIKATVGKNATLKCSFEKKSEVFTVEWTLCCGEKTHLEDHLSYKGRVIQSPSYTEITIIDLNEEDTEKYCCQVYSGSDEGYGNGTLLEVLKDTEYPKPGGYCSRTLWLSMATVHLVFLTFITILLGIIIKKMP
ncbi:uncharacterized protein [Pyxicephalus adspersus]|uniref:uncharacterized protein n=1 Tax=Pyxicephalus adspersus TaxID=30357 RepID=UPI003B58F370